MQNIKILDCTLRDGGYVNNNNFGLRNIKKIHFALKNSNVDIIECGYIKDDQDNYDENYTEYNSFLDCKEKLELTDSLDSNYTLMLLGEKYDINNLPDANRNNNTIRMSFHRKSLTKAVIYAKIIKSKGYQLFLQPTVTIKYTNEELDYLIEACNLIKPYGVAIVDTFGEMIPSDVKRLSLYFDKRLDKDICLCFHPHNNLQNAYANAIEFINTNYMKRTIIVDSSIGGMGRGAGNLPTELILDYLNKNYNTNYNIEPIIEVFDDVISKIKEKNNWGYSLPYYLSAIYGCHPSYIIYFLEKHTLTATDINNLLKMITLDKKVEYDKEYAMELYTVYNTKTLSSEKKSELKLQKLINGKNVLLIGPGKSIVEYHDEIMKVLNQEDIYSISVNNNSTFICDAIFYSNKKRYNENSKSNNKITLLTSNIKTEEATNELIFDYSKYLAKCGGTSDNSVLMLLNILRKIKPTKVIMAGFDGFNKEADANFYSSSIEYLMNKNYIDELNKIIRINIEDAKKDLEIKTITPSKNID